MVEKQNILNYLSQNKSRLFSDYHLTQIGLFGSFARGEQTATSDIDLVVEFESNTSDLFTLKLKLKEEIKSRFNKEVDICRLKYIKPIFKAQILSEVEYV